MSYITEKELVHLAQISQITLQEEDKSSLLTDINQVLEYASGLKKIVCSDNDLPGMPHAVNMERQDRPHTCDADALLRLAPDVQERYFIVPVIIKQS
jgi:aspartyl/glutamyl-tRNA(Asn/Gln) amidotransferase C subunit